MNRHPEPLNLQLNYVLVLGNSPQGVSVVSDPRPSGARTGHPRTRLDVYE